MRSMIFLLSVLLLASALVSAQSQASSAAQDTQQQKIQQQDNSTSTLAGCLTGKPDGYQVTDQSGTQHLLLNPVVDLSSYVGHSVELTGIADDPRDASASSDEGTAHGNYFFKVVKVNKDLGACK
jgi:hypothetical protein